MRIAIIGAGLAGTACGFVFKNHGFDVSIYEAADSIAAAASGNEWGLFNPRLSATLTPQSQYFATAFRQAVPVFCDLENINLKQFGSMHLMCNERREKQLSDCLCNWRWDKSEMQFLSAEEGSKLSGVALKNDCVFLPKAGVLSPVKLCERYAKNVPVYLNHHVTDLEELEADIVILSTGLGTRRFSVAQDLPLRGIRGQVTQFTQNVASSSLKKVLCYGGYCVPAVGGIHMVGATFEPWAEHTRIAQKDDVRNLDMLHNVAPQMTRGMEVVGHRAAVRVAMKDRFPAVGRVSDRVFVSVGHGSHGIVSSLMAARVLLEMVADKKVTCLPDASVRALNPLRFSS